MEPKPRQVPPNQERPGWLRRLEIDQAVLFAVAARGWQFLAGPLTVLLISEFFSGAQQGYYYTFWSLITLQAVFDFSLHPVIVHFSSHEWEAVERRAADRDSGRLGLARLASLLRGSLIGYGLLSAFFLLVVGGAGWTFFALAETAGEAPDDRVAWRAPWLALVALTALNFWTTPWLAMLEGCDQVRSVYRLQFARAVAGNLIVWLLIPLGAALWVTVAAAATRLVVETAWVVAKHRRFFGELLNPRDIPLLADEQPRATVDWRGEVWPFQWRVGLRGLLGFFNTFLINPVVFFYHGDVAAGQLGMTWQILTSLQAACMAWIKTRTAKFGMLVASRRFAELDRIFFRLLAISGSILASGAATITALVFLLGHFDYALAERMLPTWPTAMLAVAMVLLIVPESQWTYIHAHKRSPQLGLAVLGAALSGWSVWWCGRQFGATGVIAAYLGMIALYYLPLWSAVWWNCRSQWHREKSS